MGRGGAPGRCCAKATINPVSGRFVLQQFLDFIDALGSAGVAFVLLVSFGAGVLRGYAGFGFALAAVPAARLNAAAAATSNAGPITDFAMSTSLSLGPVRAGPCSSPRDRGC